MLRVGVIVASDFFSSFLQFKKKSFLLSVRFVFFKLCDLKCELECTTHGLAFTVVVTRNLKDKKKKTKATHQPDLTPKPL